MKIAMGCDHGGFDLKTALMARLVEQGHEVLDKGCYSKESCDYPEFGHAAAYAVADGEADFGIVICTTGIGISISANKVPGIRAALCTNAYMAKMTRLHNNANVLALGAGVVGKEMAELIMDTFLSTDFSGVERHERSIRAIEEIR